jgi:ADP-ribose pyrophosphatase YjhB (NUDIX family)
MDRARTDSWSYCPYCAGPLIERDLEGRSRRACSKCGRIMYRNPVPAAGCAVEQDGRLLLAKRKHAPWAEHWYFPSGFVEYDEDVEETARREVFEETGLVVETEGVFGAFSYFDDPRKNGIIILFRARVTGGILTPGDDASEAALFAPNELPERIGFASHRRALAQWLAERRHR